MLRDLSHPEALLQIICGLFLIPHNVGKMMMPPPIVAFFEQAGLRPARFFMVSVAAVETVVVIGLTFGIYPAYAALLAAAQLLVATLSLLKVRGLLWIWHGGGVEFPVFWSLVCLVVAWMSWP